MIRCPDCEGSGSVMSSEIMKFVTEEGDTIEDVQEIGQECSRCDGYGNINCTDCDGKKQVECKECHGKGMVPMTCLECNGKGKKKTTSYFEVKEDKDK